MESRQAQRSAGLSRETPRVETQNPIALLAEPHGPVAEAYRTLRAAISKHVAQGKRSFVIASAWPGDGKSMVCTNLAVSLAQMHLQVLLVDGDLRRPTISRIFGAHERRGLTDLLEQRETGSGYKTRIPNLRLMPRGVSEKTPSNLLSPDRLAQVFKPLKSSFDVLIIDTPPLSACSDALLIGSNSDGAIIVVSPQGWDGEVEQRYKQQLIDHEIPVLGAVLNGAESSEQFGYGYGYGYGYGRGYGEYGRDQGGRKRRPRSAAAGRRSWPWSRPDDAT